MKSRPSHAPFPSASKSAGRSRRAGSHIPVAEAEAALVEHYPRLVRLAYLALPVSTGRHRRVLLAHRLAQRSLRVALNSAAGDVVYPLLRREVLRGALAGGRRNGRLRTALTGAGLPQVVGLRMHPRAGGGDELALDRALAALPAAARAAYGLLGVEGLDERAARDVLAEAGADDPRGAVRTAAAVDNDHRLLAAGEFDPCTVQVRPTDLLRRRQRARAGLAAAAAVAVGAVLLAVATAGGSPEPYGSAGSPGSAAAAAHALDPAALVRASPQAWTATARLDFTAWPARGNRAADSALLGRALAVWAHPAASVQVTATPGTPRTAPAQPPQLLYAGDVDAVTVVVFYDGLRLVRYAQARSGGGGAAALDFAQVEGADITTAAAVVLDRVDGNTRFLTAPWVADAAGRDLLRPGTPAVPLHRAADGTTDPVRMPGAGATSGTCGTTWPALQLRSSGKVAEQHSFLLTDLGDLTPVHLTFTPPPAPGDTPRAPREATGAQALASWAHGACRLGELRGQGVRSVNDWQFARMVLPEGAGSAAWTCDRADTWRGPGRATVQFLPPGAPAASPGTLAGRQSDGSACSRFSPHVMAGVMWKSPGGRWYLLAAGSRDVTAITSDLATASGATLAAPAPRGTRTTLSARTTSGLVLHPLGGA
ncbi:hypothetical protein [Actinacidiphila bryophytorum]|uniref:DNA-directed RNA polymerase specialized sigma24 family protein n=1 Tax=Actinacidiphila bryophytorum TaxID=1436133 RepID=A0A9W4H042_9ACTN|nr:hypothetical protein [Actinacidiphila bryophytorum]MBM9440880.1 hypothetical protein [Actinacidiphila bryophytorum]MBN6543113.1 hypothetical protein [Actinacidiphila bryophytorum]CAG7631144.1 conserved hypothetical protein [Actinacidiphila bryophytorum]